MEYEKKSLVDLKAIAKERGMKKVSALKKQELIEVLLQYDKEKTKKTEVKQDEVKKPESKPVVKEEVKQNVKPYGRTETGSEVTSKSSGASGYQNYRRRNNHNTRQDYTAQNSRPDHSVQNNRPEYSTQNSRPDHSVQNNRTEYSNQNGRPDHSVQNNRTEYSTQNSRPDHSVQNNRTEYSNQNGRSDHSTQNNQSDLSQYDSGDVKSGILECNSEGFGFIRCDNFLPGDEDVYVSPSLIRRYGLRTGDIIVGNTKIKSGNEKFSALLYIKSVNGYPVGVLANRPKFEELTPIFPNERIRLETPGAGVAMRMVDLISPIGKGQRGMIVSQPKTGKTTLLKQVAKSVTKNHPEMYLIILLIDERPEEVTDIKESIEGDHVEVIYSTFDELPDKHKRVSEMVIERAKRLVEHGQDVMILLDSITRLARAYNLTCQPSGRTLSGGLDPAALHMPKKFFGAARNMREGGSLTILATALVDTGSRMDDVVFEEFKGTGNMELVLDRSLSERRIFPAIDLPKSSTRRDDLLLTQPEMEASMLMRRAMNSNKTEEAVESIIKMFLRTKNNNEFIEMIKKVKII